MILENNRVKTITLDFFSNRCIIETHQRWSLGIKLGVSYEFSLVNKQLFLEIGWLSGNVYPFNNHKEWSGV